MRRSPVHHIIAVLVFIVLETISVFLVYEKSLVQRSRMMYAVNSVSSFISDRWTGITDWFSLKRINRTLAEENAVLMSENLFLKERMNNIQTDADTMTLGDNYKLVPSLVVVNSTGRQHNCIILNKGEEDGVSEGMGVVTYRGIVGFVQTVTRHYSRVVSMLDTDSKFSVILKKNGTFGSLAWDGKSPAYVMVYDVPLHTEVSVGDTLVSSGYSAMFPYGIPIGTVHSISLNDGINYEIQVSLFENFHSLRYVNVIEFQGQRELYGLLEDK